MGWRPQIERCIYLSVIVWALILAPVHGPYLIQTSPGMMLAENGRRNIKNTAPPSLGR